MLLHKTANGEPAEILGAAHIVISLNRIGEVTTKAYCFDRLDCALVAMGNAHLIEFDIPFLLAELRMQLELGRPLTANESAPLKAKRFQRSSGSTVTE